MNELPRRPRDLLYRKNVVLLIYYYKNIIKRIHRIKWNDYDNDT